LTNRFLSAIIKTPYRTFVLFAYNKAKCDRVAMGARNNEPPMRRGGGSFGFLQNWCAQPIIINGGYRTDPINGGNGTLHGGIDLVGQGSKVLCAPINGKVIVSQIVTDRSDRTWEWGNYICIAGEDGRQYYLCHMSARYATVGQTVKAGDVIGLEGSTGYSTGSHCHLEIRENGKPTDPTPLLGIENVAGSEWTVEADAPVPEGNIPNDWSEEAVRWAYENGILKGDENGNLRLRDNATREEMLVFLKRTVELMKKEDDQ